MLVYRRSKTVEEIGAGIIRLSLSVERSTSLGKLAKISLSDVYIVDIKVLRSNSYNSKTVWNCKETLNRLGERNTISLV